MAALTSELDTAVITSKVKEILLQHNVGQKVRKESYDVSWWILSSLVVGVNQL